MIAQTIDAIDQVAEVHSRRDSGRSGILVPDRMHAHSTKADVRERLLALLDAHGIGGDAVKSRALNRAADAISDALDEAFRAGELHHDQGRRIS